MNIEEMTLLKDFVEGKIQRDKLENYRGSYKLGFFYTKDLQKAIETLLTAYEKEKEKNKELEQENSFLKMMYRGTELSDEEKQAIERLNIYKEKIKDELYPTIDFEEEKAIGVVLNLIEKQSKEIEELKEENKKLTDEYLVQRDLINPDFLKDYISKDKIKAKIEVLDKEEKEKLKGTKGQDRYAIKQEYMHKRSALQSLLEKE